MSKKILIALSTFAKYDRSPLDKLTSLGYDVLTNPFERRLKQEELRQFLPGVVGIVSGLEELNRDILKYSDLKVISRCGIGLSNVDLKAAEEFGIVVKNTPDAPTISVAEMTLGAMINLLRDINQMDSDIRHNSWNRKIGSQLNGKTVAIVGFGRIGRYLARLLKPFRVKVLAVDPAFHGVVDDVPIVGLYEALQQADIISIHISGSSEILGSKELAMIKKNAYILNAARGGVINEDALVEALKKERLSGAWFDTFKDEPYNGPLINFPQVILTPHAASHTRECRIQMEKEAVDNLVSALGTLK